METEKEQIQIEQANGPLSNLRIDNTLLDLEQQNQLINECKQLRSNKFNEVRKEMIAKIKEDDLDESFYICNLTSIKERIALWKRIMPRVEIFYAAKCNPDQRVLKLCVEQGIGFDVASVVEMRDILNLGGRAEKMIFANPIKVKKQLAFAKSKNIRKMTFDTIEELQKIQQHFPLAHAVVRIRTDGSDARYDLNEKFGASMDDIPKLLKCAKELGIWIKGVSFHVGSGGVEAISYLNSLENARKVFDLNAELGLQPMDLLDIGGGYSMLNPDINTNFILVGSIIRTRIDELFPDKNIQIIAEPGAYIVETSFYLASQIIGQKTLDSGVKHYYVNNGIYNGYMCRQFGEDMLMQPLDQQVETREKKQTTWWGQTCDSCDWISKNEMHNVMETGEWVVTQNHGAYHKDLSCNFNGFEFPEIFYTE